MKRIQTTLGRSAQLHGTDWLIDLDDLQLFHGLSVLSRALGEMVIAETENDCVDITIERSVRPRENPELRSALGLTSVKLCAEHETIAAIKEHPELFQDHLRTMLGTLQRPRFRDALFPPEAATASRALVFAFEFPGQPCRFVLERVASSKDEIKGFLRVTIEDPAGRRLDLSSLPHVVVDDLDGRTFIAGSTRIAQTLADSIRREAERGRRSISELRRPHSHLFRQFDKAGLRAFEQVHVSWDDSAIPCILESEPARLSHLLKRILLALEDRQLRELIEARETLRIDADGMPVHVDSSQLGRVLNLGLGVRRERMEITRFLERMPALSGIIDKTAGEPLRGISVFLIHHVTFEVLGLIAALRRLGCEDIECLFVAYAGDPPGSYLGPLLELPESEFHCYGLVNVCEEHSVEGHYRLSSQYSKVDEVGLIEEALAPHSRNYFAAMRAVAQACFVRQLERARSRGGRCLIVEDGGYLAPDLNQACLEGDGLQAKLEGVLIGSVEHTRNGFDRLVAVQEEHGKLAFPAFSIALSRLKVDVESVEVAVSILNAVENVLHASGRVLSRRRVLVLGSRGAIGRALMNALGSRLNDASLQLLGVDLVAGDGASREARCYRDLPREERLDLDLVFGVTGRSVLEPRDLKEWLLEGRREELLLASGSSKTEEFIGLARWIDEQMREASPRLGERRVRIEHLDLGDPLSGRVFG
ncbi:MAG: hypothetical protein ACE5F1_20010, partial [Planctomycetota bacterium]